MSQNMYSMELFTKFFNAFGAELMPSWLQESLLEHKHAFSPIGQMDAANSVLLTFVEMNIRGLEAFILLGASKIDYWHCTQSKAGLKPCIEIDFALNRKSSTRLLAMNSRIVEPARFSQRLGEFGEECRRYFNAGQTPDIDTMLDMFTRQLVTENKNNPACKVELAQGLSLFGNLYAALEAYHTTPESKSWNCDLFDAIQSNDRNWDSSLAHDSHARNRVENGSTELDDDIRNVMDIEEFQTEKTAPVFVRYAQACDEGNKDVRQLVEQLTIMAISRGFQTGVITRFPTLVEVNEGRVVLPIITTDLLLASVYGASLVFRRLAEKMGMSVNQIYFPTKVLELRKGLNELHMIKKTFVSNGSEGTFFHHAKVISGKLNFDVTTNNLLTQLFVKSSGDTHVALNYKLLAEAIQVYQQKLTPLTARKKANRFKTHLAKRVIGQREALESAADTYFKAIYPSKGNAQQGINTLTLVGVNQSGKSLMASSFVDALNELDKDSGYDVCSLSMENYTDHQCIMKLLGTGAQYVDSALGLLTLTAEINPRTCFIFENFEKANTKVQDALLTLLDHGEVVDHTSNRLVNFEQCFFIFTTSVGAAQLTRFCQ
jgi:hypothetical protein